MTQCRPEEMCFVCDRPTGKAGPGDGSIYFAGSGPWCPDCAELLRQEVLEDMGLSA